MDFRNSGLTEEQLNEVRSFIVARKLYYQPYVFTDDLEVGEGQNFRDSEFGDLCGDVYWVEHPPEVSSMITGDVEAFRAANAELRRIYDDMVDFIAGGVGRDLSELTFAEFGCNTGYFVHSLAARGAKETTGYDFTENSKVFAWFHRVLEIDSARHRFRFAEWDSLRHGIRHSKFDEVDVSLSIAVTCHLADPLHHLAFLCSKARKAVFFWCPINHKDGLSIEYGKPSKYANALSFPINFDNDVKLSEPLIRLTLEECGFADITEIPIPPGLSPKFHNWFKEQKGYIARRTGTPRTIFTGGQLNRGLPPDAPRP